jgi:hypothetical protein
LAGGQDGDDDVFGRRFLLEGILEVIISSIFLKKLLGEL